MSSYRLIALDLDGTTIDQRLTFSPMLTETIQHVQAAGVLVTLATGRMLRATRAFAQRLNITVPLICNQGASIHTSDGQLLYHNPLDGRVAAEVVQLAQARGIYIHAYIDDQLWINDYRPELDQYLGFSVDEIPVNRVDLAAVVRERAPTKLLWIAEPSELVPLLAEWSERFGDHVTIVRSHERFGEAAAPDSSKGVALAVLAEHLGIAREHVMAIGDRQNDAPMLAWAGLGLAMGNADEYARAAADAVLPSFDEDGAAWGIRRWILEQSCR